MKPFARSERVSQQIQRALSELLHRGVKDPRLKMATITSVKMTSDLKLARIYYTTSGGDSERQAVAEGFKSAAGYVKRTLARQLSLRYMPELEFFYDDALDYGFHVDALLKKLKIDDGSSSSPAEEE